MMRKKGIHVVLMINISTDMLNAMSRSLLACTVSARNEYARAISLYRNPFQPRMNLAIQNAEHLHSFDRAQLTGCLDSRMQAIGSLSFFILDIMKYQ